MIDKVISAKIPDPHLRFYYLVTTMMVHRPCGETNPCAPCMKNGKCSKHYPKNSNEATTAAGDGYTIYHCQNNGQTATLADGTVIDNRNIVPYCPLILLLMESHST